MGDGFEVSDADVDVFAAFEAADGGAGNLGFTGEEGLADVFAGADVFDEPADVGMQEADATARRGIRQRNHIQ